MAKSPILGGFSRSFSQALSDSEAFNLFTEIVETKDAKVPGALYLAAGLDLIGNLGNGPVRGAQKLQDVLYVVSGPEVYSLTPNGIATPLGTVVDVPGPVSMFDNGKQLMIVDGVGGWLVPGGYPLTGGTITATNIDPSDGGAVIQTGVAGGLYAINDEITLLGSSGEQSSFPILTVTSVVNNPVTFYALPNLGTSYNTALDVATTAVNGQPGIGTGLTLDLTATQGVITAAAISSDGGGTNYAVGDTGTIGNATACYQVTAVSAGAVTAILLLNRGTAYATEASVPTIAAIGVPPNIGTGFTLNITAVSASISASTLANGGNNYAVGNVGFISGGSGNATYLVTAIGALGAVTGFTVTQGGTVNSPPLTFTQKSTTGSGSGLVLTDPVFGPILNLVPITLPFPNPLIGAVSDGFGLMIFQGQQYLAASDELDLSTWDALSFGVADQSPDNTISLIVFHDEAYVLKAANSEVWVDGGLANFAFQPLSGVHMEYGCVAPFSPAVAGNVLIWLSRNDQGQGVVVATAGYDPQPISTQALIAEFDTYANLGDAIGYARQQGGHVFYVLTFPEADKTWAYDVTASQMAGYPLWHRLASFTNGEWHRHPGNCFTPWRGAVGLTTTTTTYQANSVQITDAVLETASGLTGLPTSFSTAVFSTWIYLPDGTASSGIFFGNGENGRGGTIAIAIQNDLAGTPQITVEVLDSTDTSIVTASYDFTAWASWVNILVSIDTATQALQVWANTITDNAFVESELTATSITWASSNPIVASATAAFTLEAETLGTAVGAYIAQLLVPSDDFGAPAMAVVDWLRAKVYLVSSIGGGSTVTTARSYNIEIATTQNPILSANLPSVVGNPNISVIDPATGNLICPGQNYANTQQLISVDPATFDLIDTYGAEELTPSYPTSIDAVINLVCVSCGTLASGGMVRVGYVFAQQIALAVSWAGVRADNMTACGFNVTIPWTAYCPAQSDDGNGLIFLANADGSSSLELDVITVTPGAETYDIASWPTTNPHIVHTEVGTIAATAVDATATTISCTNMGYDVLNNIVVLDVTTNGTGVPRALLGVDPTTATILWQTTVSGVLSTLSAYSINGLIAVLKSSSGSPPVGGGADVINTATGALTNSTFNGIVPNLTDQVPIYIAGSDINGLMVIDTAYTQGTGSPVQVSGTPSSFNGFAIMSGVHEPPKATLADLWFGQTAGFVDFTVVSNRRNFISSAGGAQNLGRTGSAPFVTTPPVFLTNTGMPASFAMNAGRGGAFTVSGGTLEAGVSDPPPTSQTTTTIQTNAPGDGVLGDYASGNLYAFNPRTLTDNGVPRRWLRRWRAVEKASMGAQRFGALAISVQTGIGVPDGANPQIVLRWSDDGGFTWSNERILTAGRLGETTQIIKFNRLGATRRFGGSDRIFELSSTDPFLVAILDAEVDVS